ncbi:hypothetical protein D0862_07855 [Hortaea werneckii]|uniref:DUF202 domain-containing protein n=1 Tax=Hortaea werneckii TaxID=91943 RepID=A0A3M7G9Y9_HORWE|nr:hypothetical protein D0862_07855 [Hortaea werneckii]
MYSSMGQSRAAYSHSPISMRSHTIAHIPGRTIRQRSISPICSRYASTPTGLLARYHQDLSLSYLVSKTIRIHVTHQYAPILKPCFVFIAFAWPSYSPLSKTRHASNRYHLRLHRARSVILSPQELVEIRAAQRTFEGAYIRTSLGQFSFSLVVLKIFTAEFYSIGALFAVYGAGVLAVSAFRRMQGNRQFFSEIGEDGLSRKRADARLSFRTSGNVVVLLTSLSAAAYVCLLVLTLRL